MKGYKPCNCKLFTSYLPVITSYLPVITSYSPVITSYSPGITSYSPGITSFFSATASYCFLLQGLPKLLLVISQLSQLMTNYFNNYCLYLPWIKGQKSVQSVLLFTTAAFAT